MAFQWSDLGAALCLYLVIEGILAFAHPSGLKRILGRIVTLPDADLRRSGLISMGLGLLLLFWVRS